MPFFVVTYVHPDEEGWNKHLIPHVEWLQEQLQRGVLRASGPFVGTPEKSALLVLVAPSRADVDRVIAEDPFVVHGLVTEMTVTEWDPLFGTYQEESSRANRAGADAGREVAN
ncbi:YciI family protein [Rhodococcus sp. G-MC3]|uniref:YciI family protein n=1 Tax=Rhodococcus sp. G-MC3 TaxID=3046209 RepID=UPI0024B97AF4|nr:YciI family protein [Rhodococcus sp. G-MC3]MDJ0396576.1 YciI family protein [Rhodococcus sp. G-MC3]